MKAAMMIADYAEAVNGKLYMMGAGWSDALASPDGLVDCYVAVTFAFTPDEVRSKHTLEIRLVDSEDGQVKINGREVMHGGTFVVGPVSEATKATAVVSNLAAQFKGLPLGSGAYAFVLTVDDVELQRAEFGVSRQPEGEEQ
ncbi:MAG: DUF6941 family protein [Jatrophihabitantaceae bacterium]